MSQIRQVALGILAALLSTAIILGSLSLAFTEDKRLVALVPATNPPPTPSPLPAGETTLPTIAASPTPTRSPVPTATLSCPSPQGWKPIRIQSGDTLVNLAKVYGISIEQLAEANCLPPDIQNLDERYSLFVPGQAPSPTASPTSTLQSEASPTEESISPPINVPCGPPVGWVKNYTVQKGDNLFRISQLFRTSVAMLQVANCLGSSIQIQQGWIIWVPNVPIITDTYQPTRTPATTATGTSAPTKPVETLTPEPTTIPTTEVPTVLPTAITTPQSTPIIPPTAEPTAIPTKLDLPTTPSPIPTQAGKSG